MQFTELHWRDRTETPPEKGKRILVFSPEYEINDPFRLRLIDSQFWEISKDAQFWAEVEEPDIKNNKIILIKKNE
jgi:hypothetical protein